MVPRLLMLAALLSSADAAAAGPRNLDAHQRDTIRHYVLREAKASILSPRDGEPKQFARILAEALRAAGTWVAIDQNNSVAPGETGLTVIYDHDVPADSSIFLALQRAGLNPKDVNVPGAPVATVIVAPQP
ncbi:hypothetical protein [uncultured Methylovirgula sp.]|uniref:hypothetical protein n=1 Tax=uncultured Methylovirgula sp. TaxID=1285960 RepID=UPI002611D57C|nr:hypothetical protein [uncultured Methylovirgula sp.]